jgi:hypothetical protein
MRESIHELVPDVNNCDVARTNSAKRTMYHDLALVGRVSSLGLQDTDKGNKTDHDNSGIFESILEDEWVGWLA